jgi:hypothetical protein
MDPSGATRPTPRIVRVPPPVMKRWQIALVALLPLAVCAAIATMPIARFVSALLTPRNIARLPEIGGAAGLLCIGATLSLLLWSLLQRSVARHEEFLGTMAAPEADPIADALARHWRRTSIPPTERKIRAVLRQNGDALQERSVIVCLGAIQIPEVRAERFEPVVFSPTRIAGRGLLWLAGMTGAVVVAVWLPAMLRAPHQVPTSTALFLTLLFGGAVLLTGAIVYLRATYVRLAPGMIQVLVYRWPWTRKPVVRSYPVVAGTLVLFVSYLGGAERIILRAGNHGNTFDIALAGRRGDARQWVWEALLSTAPTPPLSDEELVG